MSDVDLIINVHTNGIKDVANLSASVKALTANLREITIPMTKLDTQSRAVNKAIGITNRGMNDHAKTIKGLKENQRALGEESKRLKLNIIAYTGAIRAAGGPTTALGKELTSTKVRLQAMSAAMRGARVRAFGSDLASVSLRMQKMGKDAQFVGRSLMINLTAPIMLFARLGFQSLLKVDKEATRLTKVFDSVAMSAEQAAVKVGLVAGVLPTAKQTQVMDKMLSDFKELDSQLTRVSSKFGVSKDIVVGLASDFAELGIVGQENVVILSELTTTIEKLGGMDIGPAKDLSQALYFNAKRAYEANGAFRLVTDARERETMAIEAAIVQLNMFNAIENVTTLTLQDLADALPEVGSMATAFGLSMTEAAAMLAPMAAAGLDVGASATSIKTSLQRLILPTKKNIDFMDKLAKQYGVTTEATETFKNTTDTGLVGLEAIVDVFSQVKDSAAGVEGALKLMSQLFEKRQGPRMYIAIEQLAMFNKELKNINSAESDIAKPAEDAIRAYNKLNKTSLKETIDNFKDIGMIARVASGTVGTVVDGYKGAGAGGRLTSTDIGGARAARTAVADKVREDRKVGKDTFGDVTTEAGKAMLVQLAGPTTAAEIATQELDISLKSLSTSVQKIKNNFKIFASEILRNLGPAIKWLSAKIDQFMKYWDGLSQSTKDGVTRVIGIVLLFLAAMGPVVIALGTMQASIGVLGRSFAYFLPKIRNAEGGLIAFGSSSEVARHKIDKFYQKLRGMKSGALGGLSAAGMASMGTLDAAGIAANQASGTVGKAVRTGAAVNLAGNVAPVPEAFSHLAKGSPERAAVVAKNRTARLAHASSGRGAVDQYMRNETQMLGKKGMRVNSAGRVIGPGSTGFVKGGKQLLGEVSDASALRESRFAARGLTRGTGGEVFRTTRKGIERQITENQGMRLARGGIAGKMTSVKLGATEAVRSIGAAPAKAMQAYRNSILGAKAALRAMRVEQMAVGGGSFIKTAIVAMKGFASATKLGTLALKIMKLVMISTGIGVVIAAIGIAVLLIVKNFDKFKEAGSGAFKTIKEAFTIFVNALKEVARPFLDLFKQFSAGGAKGKSAIGGVAAAFGKIATAVKWIAGLFMKFVKNVIQPYLYAIINIVMFVVSIFTGKWGDAFDFLMAAVSQVAKFTVQGFALLMKAIVTVIVLGVKAIITAFTAIPKAAAKIFGWLGEKTGIGLFTSIGDGINSVVDGLFSLVDSGKSIVFGAIDTVAGALTKSLDKGIKKGIKQSTGAITDFGTDSKDEAEDAGEAIAESAGDGFAEALDLGGAMKKELEDVVQQLQDYVAGELKNAVDKYLTQAENALKKQKEAALKVFEVQITTLDKLEKAQESLTKTMAYESEKRKRIDDKALTDEQYRRNYALAIYEGRVDDARMLQLEQGLDEKSFTEDLKTIETKRSEELAKENLDALKTAINEAKDAAGKFFDESLIKFQEAAALITKFPPITIQDYQDQVGKLHAITTAAALTNSTEFGNMFETFVTTINDKMPNKVVGAFSMSLDALVIEAQKKYGLGGNPEDLSIIGVTLGMLAGMGDTFGDEKQTVVDAFGEVSTGLVGNFTDAKTEILRIVDEEFLTPFAESTKTFVAGFQTIYTQAILDGNTSITNSLRNNVLLNKALFDEMNGYLDATTLKWVALKVAADAAKDGGTGGGSDAPGSSGSTGTTNTGGGTKTDPFAYRRDANGNTGFGATRVAKPAIFAPKYAPKSGQAAAAGNAFIPQTVFVPTSSSQTGYKGYAKGGVIPSRNDQNGYIGSGYINAPTQEGVPALLHGGEYIVNAKAVARLGIGALEKLNNNLIPRFAKGGYVAPKKGGIPFGGEDKILANSTKKAPQALQGPYATSIPVIAPPTIHLNSVPIVKNNMPGEGGRSTVRSASFGVGGGELLLPTVVKGKILSNTNAYNAFANGGYKDHLGLYASTAAANKAAEVIHLSEANRLAQADKLKSQRIITPLPVPSVRGRTIGALPGSGNSGRWQDDTTLNIVEKGIFKGSDMLGTVGKFGLSIVDLVTQNALRVGMTMYNTAAGYTEAATGTGYSRNPFKNAVHRNTDLFYGRGLVLPGHLFDNMRITETGTPVDVMWKQISEYEKLSGEKIPLWKKVLASAGGDPVISDTIGVATLGGGSFVNAAVKSTILRGAESAAGRMLLTTALGEGGAMALTGRVAQAASLAASNRASVVFQNKNLLGRVQSGAARVTGRDIAPVAPGLSSLNRRIEQMVAPGVMSITETFGKRPSTIIGDVFSGRMSVPKGGFRPAAGSIGTGSFIDATVVGEASAATSGGLNMLRNIIPDFQVAKSLINSPTENLSAGINKSVLSSIGGKTAQGIKTFGSAFSNFGSRIKQGSLVLRDGAILTAAGLSGRKGLDYGMMATGLKKAPLGISAAQLRSTMFLQNIAPVGVTLKDRSLFNIARSVPGVLDLVSNQFKNAAILPGSSQSGVIESYLDLLNPTNPLAFNTPRNSVTDSGLRSGAGSPDYRYAKNLLAEDLQAMLQIYYGSSLYSPMGFLQTSSLGTTAPNPVTFDKLGLLSTIMRTIDSTIVDYTSRGYLVHSAGIRANAFRSWMQEFDYLGYNFNQPEMRDTSLAATLSKVITQPAQAQAGVEGSIQDVFRRIQSIAKDYPATARSQLEDFIGSDEQSAIRFSLQSPLESTSMLPGASTQSIPSVRELSPPVFVPESQGGQAAPSRIQRLARQNLLTSNLTDQPDLMAMLRDITDADFLHPPMYNDLQHFLSSAEGNQPIPWSSNRTPYKTSLYLKSRLPKELMNQPGGNVLGTLSHLTFMDSVYNNMYESYLSAASLLQGNIEGTQFPLWMPTIQQFDSAWEDELIEFIASAQELSMGHAGGSQRDSIGALMRNQPYLAEAEFIQSIGQRMKDLYDGVPDGLSGGLANLRLTNFDRRTGQLSFDGGMGRPSSGWFYGLREGRGMLAVAGYNPVTSIAEVVSEIGNGSNGQRTFSSLDILTGLSHTTSGGFIPATVAPGRPDVSAAIDILKGSGATIADNYKKFSLADYFRAQAPALDHIAANSSAKRFFSGAPSSWSYTNEADIQEMLESAPFKGLFGSGTTPVPSGFQDVVDNIFGEESEEFASLIWKDWALTRETMFNASPDPRKLPIAAYGQSPFDSRIYEVLDHHSTSLQSLFGNAGTSGFNLGASVQNGSIVSTMSDKYNRALYYLAHRLVYDVKGSLIGSQGYDILQNPIVKLLTGEDILRSRQFAEKINAEYSTTLPNSPLDNLADNIFNTPAMDSLQVLGTGHLFSSELPMSPMENQWLIDFAEHILASPLDLSKRIPLPAQVLLNPHFSGPSIPGFPKSFTEEKYQTKYQSVNEYLADLLRDHLDNYSGRSPQQYGSQIGSIALRARTQFPSAVSQIIDEKLNPDRINPLYGPHFNLNPDMMNDPEIAALYNLINDAGKAATMAKVGQLQGKPGFPSIVQGKSLAYSRALLGVAMLQGHKMPLANVGAQYSGSVSHYAQRLATRSPVASLFPGGENEFSPFGLPASSPDYDFALSFMDTQASRIEKLLTPSAMIELIGNGIKAQGKIGGLLPKIPGSSFALINPNFIDSYGDPIYHQFKTGGYVPGSPSTPVPAILHGGEYVINADAVRSMGVRTMQSINRSKFNVPSGAPSYSGGGTTSVSTVNINVDTFVGEEEWFKSMMKSYNVNVLPKMNKAAGNESRTFSSYNGIQ